MLEKLPPLASVRAFEAAARHGNFAKAAAELGTSAASVSYHVRQLEREIGVPLFQRHAQRVELTEHGRAIAPEVTALFKAFARCMTTSMSNSTFRKRRASWARVCSTRRCATDMGAGQACARRNYLQACSCRCAVRR
jgi:DNA-binding transcriptional LysR family regulator